MAGYHGVFDAYGDGSMERRMARQPEYGKPQMVTIVTNSCNIFATPVAMRMDVGCGA